MDLSQSRINTSDRFMFAGYGWGGTQLDYGGSWERDNELESDGRGKGE